MVTALFVWLLGLFGVAPTPDDFRRYDRNFRERGHHVFVEFGGTRYHATRWSSDEFEKEPTIGFGYNYLIDRKYNGLALEVLGQVVGKVFHARENSHEYTVAGGFAYYPIRHLRLFTHSGANIEDNGHAQALGRVGVGYRIMFFAVGMQPYAYVQTTTDGSVTWSLGARIEY